MSTITVVHRGLGLWIDRADHWEVLFPVAENELCQDDDATRLEPHEPYLFVPRVNRPPDTKRKYKLKDHCLDLREAAVKVPNGSVRMPFMIGLTAEPGTPARDLDAFWKHPAKVAGAMLLPRGVLTGTKHVGHVEFNGVSGRLIASAIHWTAGLAAENPVVKLTNRATNSSFTFALRGDPLRQGRIKLRIRNLSQRDVENPLQGRLQYDDEDFAGHYALTRPVRKRRPVPNVTQPILAGVAPSTVKIVISDQHLCSGAYLCDPPEPECDDPQPMIGADSSREQSQQRIEPESQQRA